MKKKTLHNQATRTMKRILLNLFLLSAAYCGAQGFTHSLSVFSGINGMQALPVAPDLKNIASTDFSDVRMFDKDSIEVPYFIVNESFDYALTSFREYEVIDKSVGKHEYTSLTVVNPKKEAMQNIVFCTANSDAVKRCDIVGSDDNKQWFSISDHIYIHHLLNSRSVDTYMTLYFPIVNYKYIKILIDDRYTLPYNIKKAGYFEGSINAGKMNSVKPASFQYSSDKAHKASHATFKFEYSTIIDNVTFKIKSPNYYKRTASFFIRRTRKIKTREEEYKDVLFEFELNSDTQNSFNLAGFRQKEFEMEVLNEDNQPLDFDSIEFKQLQTYLVADFKAGGIYTLYAGNKKLSPPVYDIEHFRNKITQFLPTLSVGPLNALPVKLPPIEPVKRSMWQEPWFMWMCIAIASFMLFLFSIRILKDMKNRGEE
jgi:hypothetical protein